MKILPLALIAVSASAQIYTKSGDNARTSAYTTEITLTPAAVANGMTMLPRIPCIGDARGCEAQPLIAEGVMALASNANVIRGVEPTGGAAIWQTGQLCVPVKSTPQSDMWRVNDNFGILSTPVIDPETHKLYTVAHCSKDGSGSFASMSQRMFVLDFRTGQVLANVLVDGSDQGMRYADAPRKQRAALLLWKYNGVKMVVVLAGSFSENGANATGWLLAYDTFDNRFKAALSTKAGGWLSGEGPAEDMKTGLIYLGLGNGPFDSVHKFGEAAMQIQLKPPTGKTPAAFSVLHAWAPFSDDQRTCKAVYPAIKVAGESAPSETMDRDAMGLTKTQRDVPGAAMPMQENCDAAYGDQDAHLTGALVGSRYISAGKDGIAYVFNTDKFPDTKPADFNDLKANCAKVGMYQAGWNLGMDSCPVNAPALNRMPGGKTRHQHAPIAQYAAPSGKTYLLFCAENSPLQVNRLNPDGSLTYIARGAEVASANVQSGMPGCFTSVSSNSGQNAIAWSSFPLGDANRTVTNGYLAAYDLTHLEDAQPSLPTIWKSETYVFSKFSQPIIWNGVVSLPDYSGSVMQWILRRTP